MLILDWQSHPFTVRDTAQFSLDRIFNHRLSLLQPVSVSLGSADFVHLRLDLAALRMCYKCSGGERPPAINAIGDWLNATAVALRNRRTYASVVLLINRVTASVRYFVPFPHEAFEGNVLTFGIEGDAWTAEPLYKGLTVVPYPSV